MKVFVRDIKRVSIGDKYPRFGYTVTIIWRKKNVVVGEAIWDQDNSYLPRLEMPHYQVHILKIRPAEKKDNYSYPERETLRGLEDWGSHAWTYHNYGDAMEKAIKMTRLRTAKFSGRP